ncbi:putative phosphatase regulatory subunit-domain-containing protein [Thamnocephalis sphaerospora]|uniref:Putative phosphatase regulatory subunit-domain-containing protein n=1 Tax=Thamnocephalis sphaerospora TaxID=78915 RepID=A0A4P9XQ46_9FUNG|nr:putative phosphatase regulatory subunit-domain-containing protein [Thamnocephalis sphaerospora]|eukprot:RKP08154.1 putative phosphatase regulatory subunit-domain-containing protein [Thamnocephalis sphaerospora]
MTLYRATIVCQQCKQKIYITKECDSGVHIPGTVIPLLAALLRICSGRLTLASTASTAVAAPPSRQLRTRVHPAVAALAAATTASPSTVDSGSASVGAGSAVRTDMAARSDASPTLLDDARTTDTVASFSCPNTANSSSPPPTLSMTSLSTTVPSSSTALRPSRRDSTAGCVAASTSGSSSARHTTATAAAAAAASPVVAAAASATTNFWGTRHVRLFSAKPKLAQVLPKKTTAPATSEMTAIAPGVTLAGSSSETRGAAVLVKSPPLSAPAAVQRSHMKMLSAEPMDSEPQPQQPEQQASVTRPVAPLHYMSPKMPKGIAQAQAKPAPTATATAAAAPTAPAGEASSALAKKPQRTNSAPNLFNPNDGRPSGLWARRQSLVTKKSGEIVKPSLKLTKGRGMKPRSISEPTTPTKFVHFDSQIRRVRFFSKVESPESVAGTESESDDESDDNSIGDDDYETLGSESESDAGLSLCGTRSCGVHIKMPNFPTASLFDCTVRPVSIESIKLAEGATHLCVMIRCQNLAFQKTVLIRYTDDDWSTSDEICGEYHDSIADHSYDRFLVQLPILKSARQRTAHDNGRLAVMDMCVRYIVDGKEFWDNNHGRNYCVVISKMGNTTRRNKHSNKASKQAQEDYFTQRLSEQLNGKASEPPSVLRTGMGKSATERQAVLRDAEKAWHTMIAGIKDGSGDDEDEETHSAEALRGRRVTVRRSQAPSESAARCEFESSTGRSPDSWNAPIRKPNNKSFGGRYDFGASLKAAKREVHRRSQTAPATVAPGGSSSSSSSDEGKNRHTVAALQPRRTQIGFALPSKRTPATVPTTARPRSLSESSMPDTVTKETKASALTRAIDAATTAAACDVAASPKTEAAEAPRAHDTPALSRPRSSTALSAPVPSDCTNASLFAGSPSVLFLDEGLRQYASSAASMPVVSASPSSHAPVMTCFASTPIVSPRFGFGFSGMGIAGAFGGKDGITTPTGSPGPHGATRPAPSPRFSMPFRRDYALSLGSSPLSSPSPSTTPLQWIRG